MTNAIKTASLLALAILALPVAAKEAKPRPLSLEASVAAADRPGEARELDASRKPAETLALLGLKPGMKVADIMTGTGYWADILAEVVGPKGKVTALEPEEFYADPRGQAVLADLVARNPNLTLTPYPFKALAVPANSFDAAIIHLSYHDLYWQSEQYKIPRSDPAAFVAALYAAMKPGGRLLVVDHVGGPGDTRAIVDKLHRIDPAVVKADFERAGFRLAKQSDHLANPADDHTKLVFDPAVRGKTDRFVYLFEKRR
ncbi:class I SAM-dependent methyltransferase [Erythrobacter sp. NE805]|uniref:class I SAM-dependent methyltransferase n=1 Tax=Erythrobacter sp. NE805 TaxID=3389875 RepID=UPI00396B20A9